jgi:hypothetical protein
MTDDRGRMRLVRVLACFGAAYSRIDFSMTSTSFRLRWQRMLLSLLLVVAPVRAGSLLREVFAELGGVGIADLTNSPAFPGSPTFTETLTSLFEAPTDVLENYGQRLRGTFTAPVSGNYKFWIASDDAGSLYLSTDANPANRRLIAFVPEWTGSREWAKFPSQESEAIALVAGRRYYIEALMKEGGGGDNLAVRWLRPDGRDEGPIPLDNFLAWGLNPEPPRISQQPVPVTVQEGRSATFSVNYDNAGFVDVFWLRNGTPIPDSTGIVLTLPVVTLSDDGALFRAFLTNSLGGTNSTEVRLTVTRDSVRPVLVSAIPASDSEVQLQFDEPVRPPSGNASDSFSITPSVPVLGVSQDPVDPRRLFLTTGPRTVGLTYTVSVSNVPDRAQTPNLVAAGSTAQFAARAASPFLVEAEDFNFGSGQTLPVASVMPYTGGAYSGRLAVQGVDYERPADSSSPVYRNDTRIPINDNPDLSRADGAWSMSVNFKLGWIGDGQWYNYTRTVPPGRYQVFAAMSHGDTSEGAIRGSFQRVTGTATTATQTLENLGSFVAAGTGGWGVNALVPLRDASGAIRTLGLGGVTTFRMNPTSGDYDYLLFMPAAPPRIVVAPQPQTVLEGRDAVFTVNTGDAAVSGFQWTSNAVPILGATNATLVMRSVPVSANGARIRVAIANEVGTSLSTPVTLTVVPDTQPPVVLRAFNTGLTNLLVEFSEPVFLPSGPVGSSFSIDGGATLLAVEQGTLSTQIRFTVSGLTFGRTHTLTLNEVRDRSAAGNRVAANSRASFIVSDLSPFNLGGDPATAASVIQVSANGYDVSARGGVVGAGADSGGFAAQPRTGDFDLRVRVEGQRLTDPYQTAGLVARVGYASNAVFAGAFASSAEAGSFFVSRGTATGVAAYQAPRGGYPVNYPLTWLRLRRVGNVLTGFGSRDGIRWTQLGTITSVLPSELAVGLVVAGRSETEIASARFRDFGTTTGALAESYVPTREGLGYSSRKTKIVFSEIFYHPPDSWGTNGVEFVEVHNAGDVPEDLSGWSLHGAVSYTFPAGFRLGAGAFAVVAADPAALRARHGLDAVLGPFSGNLSNQGEALELRDEQGARKLLVEYDTAGAWPVSADGAGHSLVLVNPSYGENDPRAWAASAWVGGNPGEMDPVVAVVGDGVVVNELLAHTDLPQVDYVELHNAQSQAVDLSGVVVTDDASTNRFRFPAGTTIPGYGFLALTESQLGFRLSSAGETVLLVSSNGLRVLDAVRFGAQENGVAFGRSPDGSPRFSRLAATTPGAANAPRRVEDVVINEIFYNPISQDDADEFIELHNRSGATVDLGGWRISDGVDFRFPSGATIPAGGYVVVASDRARLLANHPTLSPAAVHGDWSGSLSNGGERIALTKSDVVLSTNELGEVTSDTIHIAVSEVSYLDGGRWGKWADGGGSSLELVDPRADTRLASSWADSDESAKAPWQEFTVTRPLAFGVVTPDRIHLGMLGAGECLVDDLAVNGPTGTTLLTNGGFETGSLPNATGWAYLGHHSRSRVEAGAGFGGGRALRVIAPGDLDTGRNCIRGTLAAGLNNGITGTIRARVRWQAGWPELLVRTLGGGLELAVRMNVPKNLGTPGAANSRRIANSGPSIWNVSHRPAVPDANQPVVVSARVEDPDGVSSVALQFRAGESGAFSSVAMRDDGLGGDLVRGDGLWSGTLTGRPAGTLVQFRVVAFDAAGVAISSTFPSGPVFAGSPAVTEANLRWGDPVPFGTFTHIHSWTTPTVDNALNANGLDNTYRDTTLVHGNLRVIYNAGIRRKGSPFTGQADFAVTVADDDDLLLGAANRVYGLTGNGGEEATRMRTQIANWFARRMGIPYLESHYIRFFRNGGAHGSVGEDLEQPSNDYAEGWFPDGEAGDLHKVAFWFEVRDDGGFDAIGADLGDYRNPDGSFNVSRYRWNWQPRPNGTTASDFTNFFALISAANLRTTNYIPSILNIVDMDQWMRTFAYDGAMGNWDTWGTGNSQNKYVYYQPGGRWRILPWDMDWVLGVGDGPSRRLFDGNDGNVNFMFSIPEFRRMAWRGYQTAVDGPFQPAEFQPQFNARSAALAFNQIGGVTPPTSIAAYLNARRDFVAGQIRTSDPATFSISSNGGADFTSSTAMALIEGSAPFAAAGIEVNGVRMPVEWIDTGRFRLRVPLTGATNRLELAAVDRLGNAIAGLSDSVTVRYSGAFERVQDFVVIHEIHYNPVEDGGSFIELHNRSTTTAFDLSGAQLGGVGYTFPDGAVMPPGAFWVLARDRAAFSQIHGAGVLLYDEFPGSLDNGGERIALTLGSGTNQVLISDVRYDDKAPWPTIADGQGSSLQLVDPSRGSWRVANWVSAPTNSADRVTPGRANAGRQSLAAFPGLWINEVLPDNPSGPRDNAGDRDPFVEIINAGANTVDLSSLFLTDSTTNLTRWSFPSGTLLAPGALLTVWADGEAAESTTTIPHTPFRLNPTNGLVALARRQGAGSVPAVLDYVTWEAMPSGRAVGSIPDGQPRTRRILYTPTPGATNDPVFPDFRVTINEFMAQNTSTIMDPADGDFDDWIELHNAGTNTVDLTGFFLTDRLTNATTAMFRIPPGYPIAPGGFLLVWADGETGQNSPTNSGLHANFALARTGEQVGLFDPSGGLVDSVTFGVQTNDVSVGRFPDGAPPQFYPMSTPTPGAPNILSGANRPPQFAAVPSRTVPEQVALEFPVTATDPDAGQTLTYFLGDDAPPGSSIDPVSGTFRWSPSEADGPGSFSFLVRATDSGSPARTAAVRVNLTVSEVNRPPAVPASTNIVVAEGATLTLALEASDPDLPANTLVFEPIGAVPPGLILSPAGVLTWTPGEEEGGGLRTVGFKATDSGVPALSATGEVRIAVAEVNNPPLFAPILPQAVDEGASIDLLLSAADPEGQPIRFQVDGSAPSGFALDSATGRVTWTPSEAQGPGSFIVLIRAVETAAGGLSSVREMNVVVREVNQAPVLGALEDLVVGEGETVSLTAVATDADLPSQQIRYDLEPGAPAGALLDPVTGVFRWTVPEDLGASTNRITVRASDDGPGNLSATRSFQVVVVPRFRVVLNEVLRRPPTAGAAFVEVLNASARTDWNISGYRLVGSNLNFTFPAGSLLRPGGLLVVAADVAAFRSVHGATASVAGAWTGSLGSEADSLRLLTTGGQVVSRLDYDGLTPWPAAAATPASLQLVDARQDINRAGNWDVAAGIVGDRTLVGFTNVWRYFQNGPPGTGWNQASFNDTAWPQGGGLFFVESAALPTNKTTALVLGQTTYYFRTRIQVPALPSGVSVVVNAILDDGYVLWVNGQRAHSLGMEDAVPNHETFANRVVSDGAIEGPFTIPANLLVPGENTIAVEVHQANVGSSDIVFGLEMVLQGGNLSPSTPGLANNVTRALPAFPAVRINEVAPRNTSGLRDASGTAEPWIELVNTGAEDVPLDGLSLVLPGTTPASWSFPAGRTLPARGFLVVFADGQPAQTSATELHAGFRLPSTAGQALNLVLQRTLSGAPNAVDYLHATVPSVDNRTVGHLPDGEPASVVPLDPTPGASNSGVPANRPPEFATPADAVATALQLFERPLTASDPDAGQVLAFSLVSGPSGLAVSPGGLVSWTPPAGTVGSTNRVVVRVTDSGTPPLSVTNEFRVVVRGGDAPPVQIGLPTFGTDGNVRLRFATEAGRRYRIESGSVLGEWPSAQEVVATGTTILVLDPPPATGNRFYRVIVLP